MGEKRAGAAHLWSACTYKGKNMLACLKPCCPKGYFTGVHCCSQLQLFPHLPSNPTSLPSDRPHSMSLPLLASTFSSQFQAFLLCEDLNIGTDCKQAPHSSNPYYVAPNRPLSNNSLRFPSSSLGLTQGRQELLSQTLKIPSVLSTHLRKRLNTLKVFCCFS